jgi:ABC-type nickel/cobalt efflux system permease component RcnA
MRRVCVLLAALGLFIALPSPASAHPLGNFTVNHYTRLTIAADEVRVAYILDMAEIPSVSERQRIDTDDDGNLTSAETNAYLDDAVPRLVAGLRLTIDGARTSLRPSDAARLSFAPGQAGLRTLRLELELVADLPSGPSDRIIAGKVTDETFPDQVGWREIVVVGDGATILESTAPATSVSDELRSYPGDGLDDPIDVREASFRARLTPDADAGSTPVARDGTPGGNQDPLAGLLAQGGSSAGAALLAVLVSLGLGVAHAASPGHGKTLVAAYLIGSRGTPRQAITLGLTVALTHTVGVFLLGGVVLGASEVLVPQRVIEWLAMAAGIIVIGMGTVLIVRAMHARRGSGDHHGMLDHGHGHAHPQEPGHGHSHPHQVRPISGRSVAMIGLAGGMVPSASALLVLLVAVSQGQLALGIVLIAAFGIGMALALGVIGMAVVLTRRRIEGSELAVLSHPALRRIGTLVPVASALVVLGVGIVFTLEAIGRIA